MKPDRNSYACAVVLVLAGIARGQSNASFESDTPGTAPASWSVNGGLGIVSATPDDLVASSDLSSTAYSLGARGFVVPCTAIFERFAQSDIAGLRRDTCDLMTIGDGPSRITFVPDGAGGYTFLPARADGGAMTGRVRRG